MAISSKTAAEMEAAIVYADELSALKTAQQIADSVDATKLTKGAFLAAGTNLAAKLPADDTTATITTDIVSSSLPKVWDKLSSSFSRISGIVTQKGESYPDNHFVEAAAPSSGAGVSITPSWVTSFYYFGTSFELKYKVNQGLLRVVVDGKPTTQFNIPTSTGQLRHLKCDFATAELRRIDIVSQNVPVGNIYTANTDTVSPTVNPLKIVIAGDSFTEGSGASGLGLGYVDNLRYMLGCYDIVKSGSGGTGWLKENNGRPNLRDRAQIDIVNQNPDIVIIAMGINDNVDITTAVNDTLDTIETGLPNSTIVLVGSWTAGEANAQMQATTATIEAAAAARGHVFINPTGTGVGDGWLTGTGDDSAPVGDGNGDIFISSDGTHPNDAGHLYLAQRLATELAAKNIIKPAP